MARSECLEGDLQVGLVKVYQLVPIVTRTPGPQVGLYKARSGIKWWSSEKLEPRIPPSVNLPIVVWGCLSGYPEPCQSKPTRIKANPHALEPTHTRHRPTHTHQNLPTSVRTLSQSSTPNPLSHEVHNLCGEGGLGPLVAPESERFFRPCGVQGCLAHKKTPTPIGPPQKPRHGPTVES
jgi:hypothetical protein